MPEPPQPADARRHRPAAERDGPPILAALQRLLPARGRLPEIAGGTGQHAAGRVLRERCPMPAARQPAG